jgi:hypothetical protein
VFSTDFPVETLGPHTYCDWHEERPMSQRTTLLNEIIVMAAQRAHQQLGSRARQKDYQDTIARQLTAEGLSVVVDLIFRDYCDDVEFLQILDPVVEGAVVVEIESGHAALEGHPHLEAMHYHMALAGASDGLYLNLAGDQVVAVQFTAPAATVGR